MELQLGWDMWWMAWDEKEGMRWNWDINMDMI